MEVLYPRCAGLDVHKDTVVAAVRCVSAPRHHEVRRFATTTTGLLALADWLTTHGCTHVAMEATGVSRWRPPASRDGGHRRLLEAHLARAGSRLHAGPCQCAAHPHRPWAQDGRQ